MINLDIESQTLAAMIDSTEMLNIGMDLIRQEYFSDKFYRAVYQQIKTLYLENKPVTATIVYESMKCLCKDYGISWLSLKDACFSTDSFKFYCEKLKELHKKRQLAEFAEKIIANINNETSIYTLLEEAENTLYSINLDRETSVKIISPTQQAERMLETLAKRVEQKSNGGICTKYKALNRALNGGFLPGQLIILAAQTGKGKTAFAMNLMRDITVIAKEPGLYINTEMSDEQMDIRWITMLTDDITIDHSKIASGKVTQDEFKKTVIAMDKIMSSKFYSATISDLNINTLVSTARRFKAQTNLKYLVVDYIGRMDTSDAKLAEWQVYKMIAKRLKTLAQDLQITVLMLAQITESEQLEGARGMKNECDMFAYLREAQSHEVRGKENYYLCIDKNRDGRRGKIPLIFVGEKLTFLEAEDCRNG